MSAGNPPREVYKCTWCKHHVGKDKIVKIHMSSNCRVSNPFELLCTECFERQHPDSVKMEEST